MNKTIQAPSPLACAMMLKTLSKQMEFLKHKIQFLNIICFEYFQENIF